MVKPIVRDIFFLGQQSVSAERSDIEIGLDLQETLQANRDKCVGMAANMREAMRRALVMLCMNEHLTKPVPGR